MAVSARDILAARGKWSAEQRGKSFHDFRVREGLSVSALARMSGITRETIYSFENARHEPYASTEAKLLNTLVSYAASKRLESVPASTVYSGVSLRALGGQGQLKAPAGYGPSYRQAVKAISGLAVQREHGALNGAAYADRALEVAQGILSLAEDAEAAESRKLIDLANGLISGVREALKDAKPEKSYKEYRAEWLKERE